MSDIKLLNEFKKRSSEFAGDVTGLRVFHIFEGAFEKIHAAYEKFDFEKSDHSRKEFIKLFKKILKNAKFGNIQSDLIDLFDDTADRTVSWFVEAVDVIFDEQDFEELKSNYQLSADQKSIQKSKISSILISNFNGVISEARDIESTRLWLQSNSEKFISKFNGEMDIGELARGAGTGALAVINPWIGIPAVIANLKMAMDKSNDNSSFTDQWIDHFADLEEKIILLRKRITNAVEKDKAYVIEKTAEVMGTAIIAICMDMEKHGHDVSHFYDYVRAELSTIDEYYQDE